MELDIERLHSVVSGEVTGKKVGSTTAKIQEILMCIRLAQCRHIIVTTTTMKIASQYRYLLSTQADKEGFKVNWYNQFEGYIDNVVVRFKLKDESLNGYDDYYLVEMDY